MGFPGSGLVGSIALQYMVDQLEFPLIGTMTSKYFPPFAMMAKGLVNVPVRIYEKPPLVAIVADIPVHPMICYEVANGIMDWLDPYHPKEVVALAGVVTNEPEKRVFGVATTEEILERIKDLTAVSPGRLDLGDRVLAPDRVQGPRDSRRSASSARRSTRPTRGPRPPRSAC